MAAIQIVSARIGRTTGAGIAGNLKRLCPAWLVYASIFLLLVANVIDIGADIGAMGASVQLLAGGPEILYVVLFGAACAIAQVFLAYKRYAAVLKWLSAALFAYVATLFFVKIDGAALIHELVLPAHLVRARPRLHPSWRFWAPRSARIFFSGSRRRRSRKPRPLHFANH